MKGILAIRKIIVMAVLFLFYVPLFFLLFKAFKAPEVEGLSFYWFEQLFQDANFWIALKNSFLVATVSSLISVFLALLAVLSGKVKYLSRLMFLSLSFPEIVLALSLLSLFVLFKIPLGFTTLLIGHATLTVSFSFLILSAQIKKMDPHLSEAAFDLGATDWQVIKEIKLPWLSDALVSSFFLSFLLSLDDFLVTFFIGGIGQTTLPIQLFSMLKTGVSPKINALSFLILLFSLIGLLVLYFKNRRKKWL